MNGDDNFGLLLGALFWAAIFGGVSAVVAKSKGRSVGRWFRAMFMRVLTP
jgi:hypothetical protein